MSIYTPSEQDLQPLYAEAMANQTVDQWIAKLLKGIKSILERDPARYRAYGPYWWLVKKAFVDRDDFTFGESLDAEWVEAMDYGKPELNLLAAWAYEDVQISRGLTYESIHTLEDGEGEAVEFLSADEDMEIRGALRG